MSSIEPGPDLERARRLVVLDGITSKLMDTTTGGVFLAGLGLYLGADSFLIGLLAALPFLAQLAQLPAVMILLRVADRRRIVVLATGSARLLLLAVGATVLWAPPGFEAVRLTAVMAVIALLTVIGSASWNWWMRDLIPRSDLGRFFGRRLRLTTIVGALALLLTGGMLDRFVAAGRSNLGYGILFLGGGGFGLLGVVILAGTPHPAREPVPATQRGLGELVRVAADPNHRRMMVALTLLSTTLAVALPFSAVYLLRGLGFSFLWVTIFAATSQVAYMAGVRGWGYLGDRFGNRPVLEVALGLLIVALFGWSLPWAGRGPLVVAALLVIHFLSGFAIGGIDLSGSNILLKTAPETNPPAYLAAMSLTRAMVAGAATLAAGAAWQAVGARPSWTLPFLGLPVGAFQGLALASAAVGVGALFALDRIREEGGAPVVTLAKAMRREVHEISSVAGIRAFVHVVSYVVEYLAPTPKDGVAAARVPEASGTPGPDPPG